MEIAIYLLCLVMANAPSVHCETTIKPITTLLKNTNLIFVTEPVYYYEDEATDETRYPENATVTPLDVTTTTNTTWFPQHLKRVISESEVIAVPRVYDKKSINKMENPTEIAIIVTVSLFAVVITFILVLVLVVQCRKWWLKKKKHGDSRWSFYATETEPRAWDSLSFSQSTTDLSNTKYQSWESLSDDSCINSLDEVINQRASIMKANSKKNLHLARLQISHVPRVSITPDPTSATSQH